MLGRLSSHLSTSKYKYAAAVLLVFCSVAYAATNFTSVNVSGNITVGGSVDGRDISVDLNQSVATTASPTWVEPTVTNLNTNGFTDYLQIATPANPSASHNRLYFKSDNVLYSKTSAGVESAISGGGGGANTALSNLVPTSINEDLLPNSASTKSLGNSSFRWTLSATNVQYFNATDSSNRMIMAVNDDTLPSGNTANTRIRANNVTTSFYDLGIYTIDNSNAGANDSGSVFIETGNKTVGTAASGDIRMRTGTATGTRGDIYLVDGSEGTTGHVWTSTGTGGQGGWAADSGANTALSNLASTAVNADINDNGAGVHNIGSLTNYYLAMRSALFSAPSTGFINIADFADGGNGMLTLGLRTTPSGVTNTTSIATAAGTITEAWRTGSWMSRNRADAVNPTGSLLIETGNNTAASATSGNISLRVGTVGAGGTRGTIRLTDASLATASVGHVWTLTSTSTGAGNWAALPASGANTSLSNLVATSINQDLDANADLTFNLGSAAVKWLETFAGTHKATSIIGLYTGADVNRIILQVGQTPSGISDVPSLVSSTDTGAPGDLPISVRTRNNGTGAVATGAAYFETGNQTGSANSGLINIETGDAEQVGNGQTSGLINIGTGNVDDGTSGAINVLTGFATDGSSGLYSVETGTTNTGSTGPLSLSSGAVNGAGVQTGQISIFSGPVSTSGDTGFISIETGTTPSGTSGGITLTTGTGTTRGELTFNVPAINIDATNTAGGTTGNQTIHKAAGTVNFAAAATTLTVTNSFSTTASIIQAMARTNDATCSVKNVVPAAGTFTINMTAACTAETSVGFLVIN